MTSPAPVTPVCYRHPSRETYVRCVRCDRPICPDCMRDAAVGHQCPECVAEGRRTVRPARTAFGGTRAGVHGYVTKTLVALNVLMLLIGVASAGGEALAGGGLRGLLSARNPLVEWGGMVAYPAVFTQFGWIIDTSAGVAAGEYYRLLTSMFLHAGILHLLMNMWALWVLGRNLEVALGPVRFLALYLLSGLGGSVAVYWFSHPNVPTVGASGAIFGLFAAFFVVLRRLGRDTSAIIPVLVINLIITFTVPAISWQGHIGGMISGGILAAGLAYAPRQNRTPVQVAVLAAFALALLVMTFARTAMFTG
ncbi:MAG: rhomboid family intramembrane serine protease [Micromonosporaceae bacterium]